MAILTWTPEDSNALVNIFDFAWHIFTEEFEVLGYQTSWLKLLISCAIITLIFKTVKGIANL